MTPNPPDHDDFVGWVHLAQHYGLPTRLLDWTLSPLVALYFAVYNKERHAEPGCLWAMRGGLLNEHMQYGRIVFTPTNAIAKEMIEAAFDTKAFPG